MKTTTDIQQLESNDLNPNHFIAMPTPFEQEMVTITRQEYIELSSQINYWKAQHAQAKKKTTKLDWLRQSFLSR